MNKNYNYVLNAKYSIIQTILQIHLHRSRDTTCSVCKCTCLLCTLESLQPVLLLSHLETCFSSTRLHQCFHWELQSKLFCFHFAIFRENWSLLPDNLEFWLQRSTFLFHCQCLCFWCWESKLWYHRSLHLEHHLKKSESSSKEILSSILEWDLCTEHQ